MAHTTERRGVVTLATDAVSQAAHLVQTEFSLARAELSEKLQAARAGFVLMLIGAIFLIAALFLILQAVVALLVAAGLEAHWAVLIVAGGSAVVGGLLVQHAKERLSPLDATPDKTLRELRRDTDLVKEKLS